MLTIRRLGLLAFVLALMAGSTARAADAYAVDPVHSSITFKILHANISYIHGRFNDFSGTFTLDKADPSKSKFTLAIKVDTVDTNNQKRDEHLRAPDYFNVKQFPTMTFESKSVKPIEGGYEVSGDLTLHGVTKPLTIKLKGGDKVVEFPKGMKRVGFEGSATIKRSEFGMKTALESLGDEVYVTFGIEAAK